MSGVVRVRAWLIVVLAIGLAACTLFESDPDSVEPEVPSTTDPAPGAGTEEGAAAVPDAESGAPPGEPKSDADPDGDLFTLLGVDDQIVVQTRAGELSILTFGGEMPVPDAVGASQPVFSDDGARLAWTDPGAGGQGGSLVIADVDTAGAATVATTVATPLVSFYTAWAPGSDERLGILGNTRSGVGLAIVDAGAGSADLADVGTPYYFVWDPDGTGVTGHVASSLRTLDLDARAGLDLFDVNPSFRTPAVRSDRSVAFVAADNLLPFPGRNALIRLDAGAAGLADARATGVARFEGTGSFTLSPDESMLAIVVEGSIETSPVFSASTHAAGFQVDDALDRGLHLLDLDGGDVRQVVAEPVRAAFWSPDGERILSLGYEPRNDGIPWAFWQVHDRGGQLISRTDVFALSREFSNAYLPFYDQYAQSVRLWSPDSTRFVFPGMSEDGDAGIWIHQIPAAGTTARTAKVADGVIAFWSPG